MFFVKMLQRDLLVAPRFLGDQFESHVKRQMMDEVEGKCLGKNGFVIRVFFEDLDIIPGLVDNDTGAVSVTVHYHAIMLRPFRHEIVDAIVFNASDDSGFFARVGPLDIFVHQRNMPEDMKFDMDAGDAWISEDGTVQIREGSVVRLRVLGVSVDANTMNCLGSIKDNFLGQLE